MRFIIILLLLILPFTSYAEVKQITKSKEVVVPNNQSEDQVFQYTSNELARQAAEEAGVAISSSTKLVDGKISKEEVKMQTSAIAKKDAKITARHTRGSERYITVKVKVSVDSKELDSFLRQLMQNEALRKELEEERKKNSDLTKKIQKASKEEYNKTLNKQAEEIAKTQEARKKQLEQDMSNAKQQYMEAKRRQKAEELKATEDLVRIKKEYLQQDAALKKKIAEEKDAEVKAEMELQAYIAELAQNALVNDKEMDTMRQGETVEIMKQEASEVRIKYAALKKEYDTLQKTHEKQQEIIYNNQYKAISEQVFKMEKPVKKEWDTTDMYNEKLKKYKQEKKSFEENKAAQLKKLKSDYESKKIQDQKKYIESFLKASTPFYNRLKRYSIGGYKSSSSSKAVISFGERDIDNYRLPITIKYNGKKYDYTYQFNNVDEFRAMYETRSSFIAIPLFNVEPKGTNQAAAYIDGFEVIHLGNKQRQYFKTNYLFTVFPEIDEYDTLQHNLLYGDKKVEQKKAQEEVKQQPVTEKRRSYSSDVHVRQEDYNSSYNIFGIGLGGSFDLNMFGAEFYTQYHRRFNRWFGIHTSLGAILSASVMNSNSNEGEYSYGSYYQPASDRSESMLDTGVYFGLGIDIYLTNNLILFGSANGGYFYDTLNSSGFGGIFKAGAALQSSKMRPLGLGLSAYISVFTTNTISAKSPFFCMGLYF